MRFQKHDGGFVISGVAFAPIWTSVGHVLNVC